MYYSFQKTSYVLISGSLSRRREKIDRALSCLWGPFGGIYVDKEYLKMYDTIFGEGAI